MNTEIKMQECETCGDEFDANDLTRGDCHDCLIAVIEFNEVQFCETQAELTEMVNDVLAHFGMVNDHCWSEISEIIRPFQPELSEWMADAAYLWNVFGE